MNGWGITRILMIMVLESARKGKRVNFPPAVRREKPNALKQTYNDSFFKKMDGVGSDLKYEWKSKGWKINHKERESSNVGNIRWFRLMILIVYVAWLHIELVAFLCRVL